MSNVVYSGPTRGSWRGAHLSWYGLAPAAAYRRAVRNCW